MSRHSSRSIRGQHALVTGGAGFIGSHLVDLLLSRGAARVTVIDNFFLGQRANLADALVAQPDLSVVDLDASNYEHMSALIQQLPAVDVVFDLAVIPLPASLERPRWSFEQNVLITAALCELLREGHFPTLVHVSSSEAYGTAQTVPMSESHPLQPLTPYAASKSAGDHLVSSYVSSFGVDALIVRPFNNYGPRQNAREYAGIIPLLLRSVQEGRQFRLFGSGRQTRDFIYVTDTARAILALYECKRAAGHAVNVGSGHEVSMLELITRIEAVLGRAISRTEGPERQGDVSRHCADVSLLRRLTDFQPHVDLDNGLRMTVEWYLNLSSLSRTKPE